MSRNHFRLLGLLLLFFPAAGFTADFSVVIVKYRMGDWYNARDGVKNLLREIRERTTIRTDEAALEMELSDGRIFEHPFLFLNGHVPVRLNGKERQALVRYLEGGGFIFVNDDYGLDESFRKEIAQVFPSNPLKEVPFSHPVYHCRYDFPNGLPKIHEHDGKPAKGYGIFIDGRLALFYAYESDVADGWDAPEVHKDPPEKREAAIRMGVNLAVYALGW